nr:MAG TPA: hypothetical protein [Bacteriophage sp.]
MPFQPTYQQLTNSKRAINPATSSNYKLIYHLIIFCDI